MSDLFVIVVISTGYFGLEEKRLGWRKERKGQGTYATTSLLGFGAGLVLLSKIDVRLKRNKDRTVSDERPEKGIAAHLLLRVVELLPLSAEKLAYFTCIHMSYDQNGREAK